jgi:hypothetical protein
VVLGVLVYLTTWPTGSQPEPPLKKLPPGFHLESQSSYPTQISILAKKPNTEKACIYLDPDTSLGYSWTAMSADAARMAAEAMILQEQQTSSVSNITTEPAGKEGLNGGTLIYKKTTTKQVGLDCPDWVAYSGTWVGVNNGGLLIIAVSNVPKSKESIKGWIAPLIQ